MRLYDDWWNAPKQFGTAHNFLRDIEKSCGVGNALDIRDSFNALRLPLPNWGQYGYSSDGGYLIFAKKLGCVIRITSKRYPLYKNDRVLQPLGSLETEFLRLDINPALRLFGTMADYRAILPDLRKVGLNMDDTKADQIAFLPNGHAIIVDIPAIYAKNFDQKKSTPIYTATESHEQDHAFGDLKAAFQAACDGLTYQSLDLNKILIFWALCEQAVHDGRLVANWDNPALIKHFDYNEEEERGFANKVLKPSQRYGQKLEKHFPLPLHSG